MTGPDCVAHKPATKPAATFPERAVTTNSRGPADAGRPTEVRIRPSQLPLDNGAVASRGPVGGRCPSEAQSRPSTVPLANGTVAPPIVDHALAHEGRPLPDATRDTFERRFGTDFSDVRVHTGTLAQASTRAVGARAYAVASHLVFDVGAYAPDSLAGRNLLAHELTHVVQQRGGSAPGAGGLRIDDSGEAVAQRVAAVGPSPSVLGGQRRSVQREPPPATASHPVTGPPSVVVFGQFTRPYKLPDGSTVRSPVSEKVLPGEARQATGLRPIDITQLPGRGGATRLLGRAPNPDEASASPYKSGIGMQEALEGGGPMNVQAIYFDAKDYVVKTDIGLLQTSPGSGPTAGFLKGRDPDTKFPEGTYHTGTELRSLIAGLGAGNANVDVYIRHSGGLSIVRKGTQVVEGSPLPADWYRYLPPSFKVKPPGSAPSGPIAVPPSTRGAAAGAAMTAAFIAVNSILNAIGDEIQRRDAERDWESTKPSIVDTLTREPWLGALVTCMWIRADVPSFSLIQPGARYGGVEVTYAESQEAALRAYAQAGHLSSMGLGDQAEYRRQWINPPSPGSKPQPKPAAKPDVASAGPKSAAQLDQEIDAGIARHWWPAVALTLNAFNLDDITKRVGSDQRLTAHRRELMKGALDTMILWPPPNRVADAIHAADADAARLGRVDFIDYCLAGVGSWWDKAALAFDGFTNEDHIRNYLPRDIDKLRSLRRAAVAASLGRVVRLIDELRAAGHNWIGPD